MSITEFQTYIDQGTIEIPKEFQDRVKGRAHIIILQNHVEEDEAFIDFLMEHPYQVSTFKPFSRDEIYESRDA